MLLTLTLYLSQINAFLKRAFKYGFCTSVHTIDVIAEKDDRSLFAKMAVSQHCLWHTLFPDIKPYSCRLRPKGLAYKLPECSRDLYLFQGACLDIVNIFLW